MRERLRKHLSTLLVAAALMFGGTYYVQVHAEGERASCQAEYNQAFAKQSLIRSQLSTDSDNAKTTLLLGVGNALAQPPTTDPKVQAKRAADFLKLFSDYNAEVAKVAAERAATPLPPLPNC